MHGPARSDVQLDRTLGPDHPLARTQRAIGVARLQGLVATAMLAAAPVLMLVSRPLAIATAMAAALVASALWVALAVLVQRRRRHAQDVLLDGGAASPGPVRAEVDRLLDPGHTAWMTQALSRALHEGEHWYEYLPASRPPAGARHLPVNRRLIDAIVADLDAGHVSARAAILLERLIEGGYGAAIYDGGPDRVRRELGRIRFELERDTPERADLDA
jgi:hypothetical protein